MQQWFIPYLFPHVLQRVRAADRETDQDNMAVGVERRPKAVQAVGPGSVAQCEVDGPAV